jgi:hypothetical protein
MFKKIIEIITYPWTRYQEHKAWKKRLAELRKRDPFIYK